MVGLNLRKSQEGSLTYQKDSQDDDIGFCIRTQSFIVCECKVYLETLFIKREIILAVLQNLC